MVNLETARKYLPKDYQISDADLSQTLADLYGIADIAIDEVLLKAKSKTIKPLIKNHE